MLKSAGRRNSIGLNGAAPLEIDQVKYEKVVQPGLPIAPSKYEHLVVYNIGSMELSHGCFPPDDARNVET